MTHLSLLFETVESNRLKPNQLIFQLLRRCHHLFALPTKCHINLVAHVFFRNLLCLVSFADSTISRQAFARSIPITCKLQVRLSRRLISPTSMMTQRTQWARFFQRNMKQFSETLSHRRHFCTLQPREGAICSPGFVFARSVLVSRLEPCCGDTFQDADLRQLRTGDERNSKRDRLIDGRANCFPDFLFF